MSMKLTMKQCVMETEQLGSLCHSTRKSLVQYMDPCVFFLKEGSGGGGGGGSPALVRLSQGRSASLLVLSGG